MLRNTFCHIQGIGPKTERRLWEAGVTCWEEAAEGADMPHAHIDLRFVLGSVGYRGGLKGCERRLGIERGEVERLMVTAYNMKVRNMPLPAASALPQPTPPAPPFLPDALLVARLRSRAGFY
ncbi:MAG: hypothetical protein R6X33_14855 [Candidatus Brocadiia bacterium]